MGILDTWYYPARAKQRHAGRGSGGSAHQLRSAMSRPPRLGTALAMGRSAVAEPPRRAMSRPDAGRAPASPRRAVSRPEAERLGELGPRRAMSRPEEEARWRGGERSRSWRGERGEGLLPPSRLCCSRYSAVAATSSSHLDGKGGAFGALVCVQGCMRVRAGVCVRAARERAVAVGVHPGEGAREVLVGAAAKVLGHGGALLAHAARPLLRGEPAVAVGVQLPEELAQLLRPLLAREGLRQLLERAVVPAAAPALVAPALVPVPALVPAPLPVPARLRPVAEAVAQVGELVQLHEPAVVVVVVREHLGRVRVRVRAGARAGAGIRARARA